MSFHSVKNKLVRERLVGRNAIFATLASIAIALTGQGSAPALAENPDIKGGLVSLQGSGSARQVA
jgi:hypothetical protein